MGNSGAWRHGIGLAILLAAGSAGALENNPTLAPLIATFDCYSATFQNDAQKLLTSAQALITRGEEIVFTMDVPYVPVQDAPTILAQVAAANIAGATPTDSTPQSDYLLKKCQEFSSGGRGQIDPAGSLAVELGNITNRDLYSTAVDNFKPTLLTSTAHGKLVPKAADSGRVLYEYQANPGYLGKDKAVFVVEFEGKQYKVVVNIVVSRQAVENPPTDQQTPVCPEPQLIKTKPQPVSNSSAYGIEFVNFADLAGGAVGQTSGEGPNAIITLDDNAAGYNWFIDSTPADNSEFLPTANPYEWIAKAGSEAAGKMDMLSVLLHEYGHALGFEHSANSQDFMATTLQPGVRRLPSTEELALMAQLVGEIKGDMVDASSNTPDTPQSPLPSLPLGGAFGLALLGRLRSTRYGGWNVAVESATQYDIVANPTFTNSQLQSADGWSTTGNVAIGNGAAVLSETATSQTRLNQVFVVGEHDRFLSFTLANIALDDQTAAPDDAFEAALLDANTGLSLLGGTGLTHNDAFLNLQAGGSEHAASGITSIRNADGSRTYLVDLAGIPGGTAVNLSFDLLGFGQGAAATNSHLTIRDLRIGVPQTTDDSVTLAEDTPTTIAALANDLNAQQPGFA
ncbi:MAG: matrixin family metalloprotease, partial [Rhodocyclales bacterium]|nr:matrixin family metalloprotease [Rhodocyclales bacterium]